MSNKIDKKTIKVERQLIGDIRLLLSQLHFDIWTCRFSQQTQEENFKLIGDLIVKLTDVIHTDITSLTPQEQRNLYGGYDPYIETIIRDKKVWELNR